MGVRGGALLRALVSAYIAAAGICAGATPTMWSEQLPAPVLLEPESGARMHHFPRKIVFKWEQVPGAVGYGIQVDCFLCCDSWRWCSEVGKPTYVDWAIKGPTFEFNFYGNQPGAWRVWALDKKLRPGPPSEWRGFSFSAENSVNPLPRLPSVTDLPEPPARSVISARMKTPPPRPHSHPEAPPASMSEPDPPGPFFDSETGEPCGEPIKTPEPGVTPPKAVYTPEPEYTEEARRARTNGTVKLILDLGIDGRVTRACVVRTSRKDLAGQAVKAVRIWKFQPAYKESRPVPYTLAIDITFNLY
jgi:TonB family protein